MFLVIVRGPVMLRRGPIGRNKLTKIDVSLHVEFQLHQYTFNPFL